MNRTIFKSFSLASGATAVGYAMIVKNNAANEQRNVSHCGFFAPEKKLDNTAFVFIKPHANTKATQNLVNKTFKEKGIHISKVKLLFFSYVFLFFDNVSYKIGR